MQAPSFTSNHPSFSNPTMRQVIEEALEESSSDSDLDEVPSKAHPPSKFRSLTKAIETIVLSSDSEFEDDDEEEHNEADSMEVDEELPRPKISLTTPRRSFVGVVVPTPSKPTVSKSSSFSSRRLSPELTTHSSSPSKLSPSTSPLKRDRTSFEVLIPSGASSSGLSRLPFCASLLFCKFLKISNLIALQQNVSSLNEEKPKRISLSY